MSLYPPSEATLLVSLTVADGNTALAFYREAFDAEELFRMPAADGGVAHAEMLLGQSRIMLSEGDDAYHARPVDDGSMSSCLMSLEVINCDSSCQRAADAGAKVLMEPADQFWGARVAVVLDPFGFRWGLVQKTEDLSSTEIMERAQRLFGEMGGH